MPGLLWFAMANVFALFWGTSEARAMIVPICVWVVDVALEPAVFSPTTEAEDVLPARK